MLPRAIGFWALLSLVLGFHLVAGRNLGNAKRQDDLDIGLGEDDIVEPATTSDRNAETTADFSSVRRTSSQATATITPTPTPTATESSPDATPTHVDEPSFFNDTIPAGQLPLQPRITPGWGVSGVIMFATGIIYALVGIKNRWIHTFFSTAYITSLGVTVLIVYVMSYPVSDALQGGYVVAIIMSGCAVGGASMFFRELTEGLGCALGGFCLSMWLLCLVPGGLLQEVTEKAIFISCFTLAAFAFHFSRWTRDWALIISVSFAGATVTVLGIDCFSRAGLKEFWAYIWSLNENMFPLGADTYPITRAIRVETAVIVIVFFMGVISQIKLWRVVRDQRQKRAAERAEAQRNLEQEEENLGRQLEQDNARERQLWERAYGDGDASSSTLSRNSCIGDPTSEKTLRDSQLGSKKRLNSVEVIELGQMADQHHTPPPTNNIMTSENTNNNNKVTVRVAVDDVPEGVETSSDVINEDDTGADGRETDAGNDQKPKQGADTVAPSIVPLPFRIPREDDAASHTNRSSIATFADEDDIEASDVVRRKSANRLSRRSISLLRRLSHGSARNHRQFYPENEEGSERLITSRLVRHDEDNGSLAATIDNESLSGDDQRSLRTMGRAFDADATPDVPPKTGDQGLGITLNNDEDTPGTKAKETLQQDEQSSGMSKDETKDSDAIEVTESQAAPSVKVEERADASAPQRTTGASENGQSEKPTSVEPADSTPTALTQDKLPRILSRVAMSYRTNEWAKHLSSAESPDVEEIEIPEPAHQQEKAAPVDYIELQKTAIEGTPPPAVRRSDSQVSHFTGNSPRHVVSPNPGSPHRLSLESTQIYGEGQAAAWQETSKALHRASSTFEPIDEHVQGQGYPSAGLDRMASLRSAVESPSPNPRESPGRAPVPGVVSYSSPQTLLGQREKFLKSKSQGNLLTNMGEPASMQAPASDAGSLNKYPMYASGLTGDADDLPLSQRRQLIRLSSGVSSSSVPNLGQYPVPAETSDSAAFNSHQPKRVSALPPAAVREAQLANFRMNVAQDLRSGTPVLPSSGRETPFSSTYSLNAVNRDAEVQRGIEAQRNMILNQKEAEGRQREIQRRQKEMTDKMFGERMRSGDLLEAHREMMRKMQHKANGQ
ncbi:hypothetical protein S7711_06021 [Stachybotrys chartarum IBT 7711]|uniref:TM7S3/TM198-like domain-containing protein n=1 Tax=Stachybotrys chartarum (strain CBS 109288 / IBT 7711) TaxID=1280523 RepID=A0A084B2V1_STACB|nr:hypothetical protein S7711_06021 [Stachybotrys chartarum IBT 7711]